MPLSEDQRAMLQLLLERGQSYEDIGSLLGIEVGEVRARARAALVEIGGEDPDGEISLTDYLLGQADPIARADAARALRADPELHKLASKLCSQLRLLAPTASLPDLPEPRHQASAVEQARPAAEGVSSASGETATGSSGLTSRQRQLLAGLALVAVLLIAGVLLITGAFDGGSGSSASEGPTTAAGGSAGLTKAVLRPVGEGNGRAVVLFGRVRKTPVLDIAALGLDPAPEGEDYYVWLYRSERLALRIGGFRVDEGGKARARIAVPAEALALVANGTFEEIDVTLTSNSEYRAELAGAQKRRRLPSLTGASVMRGDITGPIAEVAKRIRRQAQSGAGG